MKLLNLIDNISDWSGRLNRWLGLALSLVVIYEVAARYVFNSPTIWAFDTAMMITSTLFLMGGAYLLKEDAHIRVDVLYDLMPNASKKIVDISFYLICFFPFTLVMVWFGTKAAVYSFNAEEISNTSQWGELIFWWRAMLPLAFLLLLLQGCANFVRIVLPTPKLTKEEAQ
mgnify:CR=1 FL=1